MMILIGDVHGKFRHYQEIIKSTCESIQLGDFGIGFIKSSTRYSEYAAKTHPESVIYTDCKMPEEHKFIRGNHDAPDKCRKHPNYLGDYGVYQDDIFYLSGAWSIDRQWRTTGIDWWPDEEICMSGLMNAIDLYKIKYPKLVITHDCPIEITKILYPREAIHTRTGQALDRMLEDWQPPLWVFAHHHQSLDFVHGRTRFICLNELEVLDLDTVKI